MWVEQHHKTPKMRNASQPFFEIKMFIPVCVFSSFYLRRLLCPEREQVLDHKRARRRCFNCLCEDRSWRAPARHHSFHHWKGKSERCSLDLSPLWPWIRSKRHLKSLFYRGCRVSPPHRSWTSWAWGDQTPASSSLKTAKFQVCFRRTSYSVEIKKLHPSLISSTCSLVYDRGKRPRFIK